MSFEPHGGNGLICRLLPEMEKNQILSETQKMKTYPISDADLSIFYRMADGALSPLEGPMHSDEFYQGPFQSLSPLQKRMQTGSRKARRLPLKIAGMN
jgi:hypothetical protein